jgi:hypothetical protein
LHAWYEALHCTAQVVPPVQLAKAFAGGVSQHRFPHCRWFALHCTPQPAAPWQRAEPFAGGARQTLPHVPQLFTSVATFVQTLEQFILGDGQTHAPPLQVGVPPPQAG